MNRRAPRGVVTTLAGLVALAACAGGAETDDTATIDVFGPNRGIEADRFAEMVAPFTDETGIEVRYTGSADFVADLTLRTGDANDPPDVALVPQPGLIRQLVADDEIVALDDEIVQQIDAHFDDEARDLAVIDGTHFGVPLRLNVKSLVWFRPDIFDRNGWAPPESLDQLESLVAAIDAGSDLAPWCFTMSAGTATGWTATDWTEDLVLRRAGPEVYDGWATGSIPFSDASVENAFADFRRLVLAAPRLHGGLRHALDTPVRDAITPLLAEEPACAMVKQADFARSWMPADTSIGADGDVDWFVVPPVDPGAEPPLVVGANMAVQFRDNARTDSFMAYLAGPDSGSTWAAAGGFISPKSSFDAADYPNDGTREIVRLVHDAEVLAFDASDQMPVAIGSDLLWREITSWVATTISFDDLATTMDEAFVD